MFSSQSRPNADQQKLYQEIKFLQLENQKLKEELSDAKDMIKMNKFQIDVLSKDNSTDKKIIQVIYNYRNQLQALQQRIETVNQRYQKLSSEKFVIQQLNQQLQSQQRSIEDIQKTRANDLTQIIKNLQQKMQFCQKNHLNYDSITGFVEKSRELLTPLDQAIEFKNKQYAWSDEISYLKGQLTEHKKNQENLLLANGILRNKVVSLQAKLAMPNKNLGQILDKSLKRLMLYFIETQKKMLTGDDSDSEQQDLELIAPQLMSLFPQKNSNDIKVPALDLLKVRNHQMKGNQKIKQELQRRNHLNKDEKIQRLQVELQFTRRSLTKVMIELKSQTERRKILEQICEQLQGRNQILLKSNQSNDKRLQKIKRQFQKNKQKISQQHIQLIEEEDFLDSTKNDISKNKHTEQKKNREYQVNKYLQSVQTPFEYKLHLELLAKDLQKNTNLNNLKDKKMKKLEANESQQSKLKRSTSNPFLYFNERRQQIFQIKPQRQNSNEVSDEQKQRLEQTQYVLSGEMNIFRQNIEDLQLDDLE